MKKRDFREDNKAQIFSLDVLLALIIITVILGISADAMDLVSYKAQDYSSRLSLEEITNNAADMLIKSSGSPDKWEDYELSFDTVPGLAKKEAGQTVPNTLSLVKILKLKGNYNQLMYGNVLPYGVNFNMVIYPVDPSLSPIMVTNNTVPENASEVAVANRTVLCDFIHISTLIKINNGEHYNLGFEGEICPHADHNHSNLKTGDPKWICNHFNVTLNDLNSTDFYVITDAATVTDSARWGIDRADAQKDCNCKFSGGPIPVNDKIAASMDNSTNTVLWFHILTKVDSRDSFDGYVVCVPKGTPLDQVKLNYLGPQQCFFVLQVWY